MKHRAIEPGLLPVFRYFGWVGIAYFAFNLLYLSADARESLQALRTSTQFGLIAYVLLTIYLSWPALERRLKTFYLPIALAVATVTPVLSMAVFRLSLSGESAVPVDMGPWSVFPVLFIPLVLIAWQYNFRSVFIFILATALADLVLVLVSIDKISYATLPAVGAVFIRAFAFGIVGHIVTQLMATQMEQRRNLIRANVQLSRHAATLEELAVSQERNRLARDLHDTLAHTLSGTAVNLEALRLMIPESMTEIHQMLDRSLENTRDGLAETRRTLKDLRSQPLEDLGVVIAIRNLALDAAGRGGLELDLDLPSAPLDLLPDVEQCIYRIVQESLANVLRHADASRIGVQLREDHQDVSLLVKDDGKGFVVEAIRDAGDKFGLRGMQERARIVGGELTISSVPQQGTEVRFFLRDL